MKQKTLIMTVTALAILPLISGCSTLSNLFKQEGDIAKPTPVAAPDPMMISLDNSAQRIALAYEKLAHVPRSTTPPHQPTRSVSSVNQPTPALPVSNDGIGRGRPSDLVQPKSGTTQTRPLAVSPITSTPLAASHEPTTFVSPSLSSSEPSYAVSASSKSKKPRSTPAIPPEEVSTNRTGGIDSMIYLPGWTGTASRAVQIIAYKIGYKVHISGFRRGAEPTVVLSMNEQTAHDALKDIGAQVAKSMRVRVDPQAQVIYLTYK